MRTGIILFLTLIIQVFSAHSQEFDWARSVNGDEYEYGIKTIIDPQGNSYFIGYTTGTPFEYNGVTYSTNGDGDAFFVKLDANNELVWVKSVGGDDPIYFDKAVDIHIDTFGDIYLSLSSSGNNFTYDGQVLSGINSPGQYSGEAVLLKVNSNGDYIWHDSGSTSSSFQKITTDSNGNLYITGYFSSSITLGSSITLTNPSTATTIDMLVAKYQSDGTILWAKNAGGMPHNTFAYGFDIEINPQSDEVLVLSKSDGAVFYDGVPAPINNSENEGTVLVAYNMDGTQNWVKQIFEQSDNWAPFIKSLDISNSGVIGVCGDGLVGFYTSDGSVISEHAHTSSNNIETYSLVFNEFNEAYVSGWCNSDAILGISPGIVSLSNTTGFIAKMDIFQQVKWVSEFTSSNGTNNQIYYDNGNIMYAGRIDASFVYNMGQEVINNNLGDALFGRLIDYGLPKNRSNITGTIFQDVDANCVLNVDDVVQSSVVVKASDANGMTHYSVSDLNGYYDIPVNTGTYTVEILPNPILSSLISQNCYTEQEVTISQVGQDVDDLNFPMELASCPLLNVDLSSDRRRRCFESNTYVSYANSGFAEAQNVEVVVEFPEYVTFVSSDHAYTIDAQGNYHFNIGTLAQNESGTIHIVDYTECINGITGLTQCTKAWITPTNDCADAQEPNYDDWDKSSVVVEGVCINDSLVQFTITNAAANGDGDMQNPHEYRIYVDNVLSETSSFQLNEGENIVIDYTANGQTIRLEADQHPMHPGKSQPQETIEGCGSNNGVISTGFVNTMPMDDLDADVEIHCLEIIDSFDPNDKLVSPTGITVNHYLEAGTTLDYMIRFQNKGTDTAYTVVIVDELSAYLDPSTIQWGLSSHPYTVKITGTETPVLEFTFSEINLPHSAVNELGSNGFVKFKVATYDTLPVGTEINNNANIYFDFNLPIQTNTVQTVIYELDVLSIGSYFVEDISIYPNPSTGRIIIKANNLNQVDIYNISGTLLKSSENNEIDLSKFSKGIYLIKIMTNKGITLKKIVLN